MGVHVSTGNGLVALVVIAMFFVQLWFSIKVLEARSKYKVPFPNLYALESENENAKTFNCVQRGHQNFLESAPIFLALLLIGGLQYPIPASVFGLLYLASRVLYFVEYSTGDPERRMRGITSDFTHSLIADKASCAQEIDSLGWADIEQLALCLQTNPKKYQM